MELTLAAAIFAGLISFLSPCVLPVVPAYLGQMGIVSAAASAGASASVGATPAPTIRSNWHTLPHAIAFVLGFGAVFTIMGLTLYAFRPLFEVPPVRIAGGLLLVILGLNLMGVLRISLLARVWAPAQPGFGRQPLGGAAARSPLGALALGAIFAIGWTPCVGPTLGAILGLSLQLGAAPQVVALLIAYSLGLGLPFVLLAIAIDGTNNVTRFFMRYGRQVEIVGGALVVLVGLAIVFDWLATFAQAFSFLWPSV